MNCELSCRYVSEQYRAEFSDLLRKRSVSHQSWYTEETPDISRLHHWFLPEMSEKLACSRRSDSAERCKVEKVMKSRGVTPFYFAPLPTIWTPGTGYWEMSAEIPYWWCVTYPDLGSASYWSCCEGNLLQPIRALPRSQLWRVISIKFLFFFSQKPFRRETSSSLVNCWLFSGS